MPSKEVLAPDRTPRIWWRNLLLTHPYSRLPVDTHNALPTRELQFPPRGRVCLLGLAPPKLNDRGEARVGGLANGHQRGAAAGCCDAGPCWGAATYPQD